MSAAGETGGVRHFPVAPDEAGLRLDRWFARHFPDVPFGRVARMARTGQLRVDGHRAKPGQRLEAGQSIRVPPFGPAPEAPARPAAPRPASASDARLIAEWTIYEDQHILVLNKPAGLAVQGGSGTHRHLDGMLAALAGDGERPRLVHRLDRDTSGVLLLARNAGMAARLGAAFQGRDIAKLYWALTVGVPTPRSGRIDKPLAKHGGKQGERVGHDEEDGKRAITEYAVVEAVGRRAAWLDLRPHTGRTHQLRVHSAMLGTPIVGDGKYGGKAAFLDGIAGKLHLHARAISLRHPATGRALVVTAPLAGHMAESWAFFGFDQSAAPPLPMVP
ncbi:MAG: RluA family pseudouridine synthase [Alphaproteobacteria bacterium]